MRFLLPAISSALATLPLIAQQAVEPEVPPTPELRPALRVGDGLPPVMVEELAQTPARSFSDFYGRVVLLEFFAYWCAPCAQSVPHLNELQTKYGPRGLSVLAVTTDAGKKTVPWIEKHGVEYAWGRDASRQLHDLFQVQGIPYAVLIDPFGTVAWMGHPMRLRDEEIESALADALPKPVWEWPEEARPLARLLAEAEFAAALEGAGKLPVQEGFDLPALVRGRIGPLVARFESLVEDEDYGSAMELGERLEKGLAALPEGAAVKARLDGLRSDPEVTRTVAAESSVAVLEARLGTLRKPTDAERLRDDVAAFLDTKPPEKFERRAKILLDTLERGLAKLGKKPQ